MASIAFPKGQDGSVTHPLSNVKWKVSRYEEYTPQFPVTGAGDANHVLVEGLQTIGCVLNGTVYASSAYGKAQSSTITPGFDVRAFDGVFVREWQLENVTGSGSTKTEWNWKRPVDHGAVRGWVIASGPGIGAVTQSLTINWNIFGQMAGTAAIRNLVVNHNYNEGGTFPASFQYQYTGGVTYTGTNFSALFGTAPADPPQGTVTLDQDTAEDISHNAIIHKVEVRGSFTNGGPIDITAHARWDPGVS